MPAPASHFDVASRCVEGWEADHPSGAPIGLYIHVPFCARKCPYCDFNTYAGMEAHHQATVDALCRELRGWRERLCRREISSVFVGGGTPTVLSSQQLAQLFGVLHADFNLSATCEITCEANPGTVDRKKFQALRSLGANRLSIGVQSFQPDELAFLGRIHDVADVGGAFEAAREAGFANINLDFMFGLPGQSQSAWDDTLHRALDLAPEHLSLYSLIVEPNTPLNHWVETGRVSAPDEDQAAVLYELAMQRLAAHDYHQYEVSNWAKEAGEPVYADGAVPALASQHNLLYWRNQEYVGVGPGAHSHLRYVQPSGNVVSCRWGNRKPVPSYVQRVTANRSVEDFREELDQAISMGETMMLGLRLIGEGVPFARFHHWHGVDLRDVYTVQVERLAELGLVECTDARVRVTRRGLMVGNQVFGAFLSDPVLSHA